ASGTRTPRLAAASDWAAGIGQKLETPPPVAPACTVGPSNVPPLFHTVSVGRGPVAVSVVPPTPVTNGWLGGAATAGGVPGSDPEVSQSSAPVSPSAATIDCPWTVACSNRVFSATASA